MPFPGFLIFVMAFPVDHVFHRDGLAACQGKGGAADLDHGVPGHFCRDGGEGCILAAINPSCLSARGINLLEEGVDILICRPAARKCSGIV